MEQIKDALIELLILFIAMILLAGIGVAVCYHILKEDEQPMPRQIEQNQRQTNL